MNKLILSNAAIQAQCGISDRLGLPERHNEITLANSGLLVASTMSEELTAYATGRGGQANKLTAIREFLAPTRPVGNARNAIVTTYNVNEPFETVDYDKMNRALLGDFAQVRQRTATKATRTLNNVGLTVRLDRDQLNESPNWQQMHVAWLQDIMARATCIKALALMAASATAVNLTWNKTTNPDLDIRQEAIDIATAIGVKPNRAFFSEQAALHRLAAYELSDNAGATIRSAMASDADLARALGLEGVMVNEDRYYSAASSFLELIASKVLIFTGVSGLSPEDPSNLVRHVGNAYGGGQYAVYITEVGPKAVYITVEAYELLHLQLSTGMELATISTS